MTTAKPKFKCPDCPKEFTSLRALGPHRNKAHGYRAEKPSRPPAKKMSTVARLAGNYPCSLCPFVAKWQGGLAKHMGAKHSQVPQPQKAFQCPHCPASYTKRDSLRAHCRSVHGTSVSIKQNHTKGSELAKTTQDVTTHTNGHGIIHVPAQTQDDHRLEAAATYAAGRVAQLLEGLALQLDVSFRSLAPLVLRTVGETTKVR